MNTCVRRMVKFNRPYFLTLLLVLYTASGTCGLVYEVVWSRWLSLILGNTTLGHSLVIGMFMAGLGAGYFLGGRKAGHLKNPLRTYGGLEIVIGLWGFLSPSLLAWVEKAGFSQGVLSTTTSPILMLGICALVLILPTFMMGATFPVMLEVLRRDGCADRRRVALLYGWNSAGAAIGSLGAGFFLLEWIGLTATCFLAGTINCLVGVVMCFVPTVKTQRKRLPEHTADFRATSGNSALATAAVLGIAAMGVQAIWIRLFAVTLGSSVFALSTVLAVFIVGIGIGSLALVSRRWGGTFSLAGVLALLSLTLAIGGFVVDLLPFAFNKVRLACKASGWSFESFLWLRFLCVTLILLPITALFGAALPLATGSGSQSTQSQVRAFWVNTVGAVLGASLTLPLFVPSLGLEGTYRLFVLLVAGMAFWESAKRGSHIFNRSLGLHSSVAAIAVLLALGMSFDPHLLSAGGFRSKSLPDSLQAYEARLKKNKLLFYEDGKDASVAVLERGSHRVLKVNGKPDASTRGDMLTQVFSGHLPMLLHPSPSQTLVVGLGSGVTAHSASLYGGQVDVVELSGAVIRAATYFTNVNHRVMDEEKVRVFETDARGFLRGLNSKFDVIISEPSNPWMAGNAGLFSVEFFENVRRALKPSGILAQWFHTYEMDDETLSLVFNSLSAVFPRVTVWEMFPNDLLLVASEAPFDRDWERMEQLTLIPEIQANLKEGGLSGITDILSRQAMSVRGFESIKIGGSRRNTDDHPRLEYEAPRSLYEKGKATFLQRSSERTKVPGKGNLMLDDFSRNYRELQLFELEDLFVLHTIYPGARDVYRTAFLPKLIQGSSLSFQVDVLFTFIRERKWELMVPVMDSIYARGPEDSAALFVLSEALLVSASENKDLGWTRESVDSMLRRCVALGDETLGRCGKRMDRLTEEKGGE